MDMALSHIYKSLSATFPLTSQVAVVVDSLRNVNVVNKILRSQRHHRPEHFFLRLQRLHQYLESRT